MTRSEAISRPRSTRPREDPDHEDQRELQPRRNPHQAPTGREFVYERARFLGLEEGVQPPPKAQSGDAVDLETTTQEPAELS